MKRFLPFFTIVVIIGFIPVPFFPVAAVPISVGAPVPVLRIQDAQPRLVIPSIGVDAVIKDMGVTSGGAMAVPGNDLDVGWYRFGTRPGQQGSAVIGGHNEWNSGDGVFVHLDQLRPGDSVSVIDIHGKTTHFVVRDIRTYDATDTNSGIFESVSGAHLNLITCSGIWNPAAQTYMSRLVVFTDAV
jgi:sortase A